MRYFTGDNNLKFYKEPSEFNKKTDCNILKYAIGANMYMPATMDNVLDKLMNDDFHSVGAITLCMEDAIPAADVEKAEQCTLELLKDLHELKQKKETLNIPLIFIRVRTPEQFKNFAKKLNKNHLAELSGFNFPKFTANNGDLYFKTLEELSQKYNEILYGMPIIETDEIIFKETRFHALEQIQKILMRYQNFVLNIRVGGTDFSSLYGLRRNVDSTIYDIKVVADCLTDIVNFFLRQSCGYVVSGPVWEFYNWEEKSKEIEGLEKELILDMENGFMGKTIIHPSQIKVVNKKYIVNYDEYMDAKAILKSEGGVFASYRKNRMNETGPHQNWAKKILARAEIFGVHEPNNKDNIH